MIGSILKMNWQKGLHLKTLIQIRNSLQEDEELIINTNHAMSTIRLYYNALHQSLLCTVKDRSVSPPRFKVKEIFLEENQKVKTLICLRFTNIVLTHLTGFDGVQHTHLVELSNKVSNKVVTVVCRRFKTDDDAVLIE